MATMVFRVDAQVDEQTHEHGYALSLHIDDGQDPDWAQHPAAADWIPAKLPEPAGHGVDIGAVRRALVTEPAQAATLRAAGHYLYHTWRTTSVSR
jgi:hypothetical protein